MPSLPELRAVIFDLDDTLYPEHTYVRSGFRAVAAWCETTLGLPADQAYRVLDDSFRRGVRGNAFDLLLEHFAQPPRHVAEMVRVYREHRPTIEPFPGVRVALAGVRDRYPAGLVTDGYSQVQRRKLEALGLAPLLDAVVFSDDLGRAYWKPAPEPFLQVLAMLDVDPAGAVYVGDNPTKDFLGARRAGLASIRVRWPEGEYAALPPPTPEHAADHTVDGLEALVRILLP